MKNGTLSHYARRLSTPRNHVRRRRTTRDGASVRYSDLFFWKWIHSRFVAQHRNADRVTLEIFRRWKTIIVCVSTCVELDGAECTCITILCTCSALAIRSRKRDNKFTHALCRLIVRANRADDVVDGWPYAGKTPRKHTVGPSCAHRSGQKWSNFVKTTIAAVREQRVFFFNSDAKKARERLVSKTII